MFKKRRTIKTKPIVLDPSLLRDLMTSEDYLKRGMAFYARKQYEEAERDLRTAISLNDALVDAYYALGLVLKAESRKEEAIQVFEKLLDLIGRGVVKNSQKTAMLRRLTKGHINFLTTGDWNLEKELWQRIL